MAHYVDPDGLQSLLLRHYQKYPQMQCVDFMKLLYQQEFGCGHMIACAEDSLQWIRDEANQLQPDSLEDAVEPIGNGLCRLSLHALRGSLSAETVNQFFVHTANHARGSGEGFEQRVLVLIRLCEEGRLPFHPADIAQQMAAYRAEGYPAMRHSPQYRQAYAPAYRVVDKVYGDFLPLFVRMDELLQSKQRVICAIDGGCTSGKTTLAALLQSVYHGNVFSMDDFFLMPAQRTAERLGTPGGNVDYERFDAQVLKPLLAGHPFTYQPYDCAMQALAKAVSVKPNRVNIVEGVYSLHPALAKAYDLKIFLDIDADTQKRRLLHRSPALFDRFVQEWIPMENLYFDTFQTAEGCEMVFNTETITRCVQTQTR